MKALKIRKKLISLIVFATIFTISNMQLYAQDEQKNDQDKINYEVTTIEFLEQAEPMQYTQEELDCLATVMYAEAGICDDMELYLVANVVINRVNDKSGTFKDSIIEVIYQKGQFTSVGGSAWNRGPTEREYAIAQEVLEGKRVALNNVYWFSKRMNYGSLYYKSKWHYFSGMDLKQIYQETEEITQTSDLDEEEQKNNQLEQQYIASKEKMKTIGIEALDIEKKQDNIVDIPKI